MNSDCHYILPQISLPSILAFTVIQSLRLIRFVNYNFNIPFMEHLNSVPQPIILLHYYRLLGDYKQM